jgi:hypothetical protein
VIADTELGKDDGAAVAEDDDIDVRDDDFINKLNDVTVTVPSLPLPTTGSTGPLLTPGVPTRATRKRDTDGRAMIEQRAKEVDKNSEVVDDLIIMFVDTRMIRG